MVSVGGPVSLPVHLLRVLYERRDASVGWTFVVQQKASSSMPHRKREDDYIHHTHHRTHHHHHLPPRTVWARFAPCSLDHAAVRCLPFHLDVLSVQQREEQ